jgi:hypothetical protein
MSLSRTAKLRLLLAIVAILLGVAAWQGLSLVWNRGYARGSVTGVVRKVSVHGPPYCKILTGELVYQTGNTGPKADLFHFSVDDADDDNPVVRSLEEAERKGGRVMLQYRQDRKMWWRCNPSEFYITGVEQ